MAVATGPVWFQLYVFKDRAISASLVKRAEVAGCKAIVFTVDAPLRGRRERDVRNQFKLPDDLLIRNLLPGGLQEFPGGTVGSEAATHIASLFDTALAWKDIEWLAGVTTLPVLVKGILRSDDALLAVKHGASGAAIHTEVVRTMEARGYATGVVDGRNQGFFHGTGHGVGLDIHELPRISRVDYELKTGQVVTVEPGLYYPGRGAVRIEDMVLVEPTGCRNLTRSPKMDLLEL